MKRFSKNEVQLSDVEAVFSQFFDYMLDQGKSVIEAAETVEETFKFMGMDYDPKFIDYLRGIDT